ncbi:MAG: methyltransferase domain-containing protein [Chromatiales bacterium]|nr:methyltransferase domain-containing protein [Chromatiales bacterium]
MSSTPDVWQRHSSQWQQIGPPLRPGPEDARIMMEALAPALAGANSRPVIGVLGVTPELVQLPWQGTVDLRAFDQSAEMIARVWTPNPNIASEVQVARWQELPAADQSLDAVIGDGSLYVLESLDEYVSVLTQVHRVLRPGGLLALRCFVRPDRVETPQEIKRAVHAGEIGSFHALKLRLSMSLAGPPDYGIAVADVHALFEQVFDDRNALAARTGWTRDTIDTIDAYSNSATRYTCPTFPVLLDLLAPCFTDVVRRHGHYELAGRCPTVATRAK